MISKAAPAQEFERLRPRLLALLELHWAAESHDARAQVTGMFDEVFLATAWHVAHDLLDNGWRPEELSKTRAAHLKLVDGVDAA